MDQKKKEEVIEGRVQEQTQNYRKLHKHSYILKQNLAEDSKIGQIISESNKLEQMRKLSNRSSIYSFDHWKYYIFKNLDLFSGSFFDLSCVMVTYPLNTIKTRIQARHPVEDVAFFQKNKVAKTTNFQGISYGIMASQIFIYTSFIYAQEFEYFFLQENFSKDVSKTLALMCADSIAAILKLPFEIRKQLLQVNDKDITIKKTLTAFKRTLFPTIIRDASFRVIYGESYHNLVYGRSMIFGENEKNKKLNEILESKITFSQRINYLLISTLVACLITNPFDLAITKLTTQQYNKYTGLFNCLKTVYREETVLKIVFGGFWARFAYYGITAAIVNDFQLPFKTMMNDAFTL